MWGSGRERRERPAAPCNKQVEQIPIGRPDVHARIKVRGRYRFALGEGANFEDVDDVGGAAEGVGNDVTKCCPQRWVDFERTMLGIKHRWAVAYKRIDMVNVSSTQTL